MQPSPFDYLRHVLDEVEYLMHQARDLGSDEFRANETLKRAFVRSLEVIGEAVKKVSLELRVPSKSRALPYGRATEQAKAQDSSPRVSKGSTSA
ncbi:MAG: HepT-like ribonuclease domain-containing protein [Terriglobia bacterium]